MMIRVTSVQPVTDFKLQLRFSNGECRCFDMAPYLHLPVYRRLDNPGFFALARVDYGTVVWPDEIDIAPETLYGCSVPHDLVPA
jgi:hypothetical protein